MLERRKPIYKPSNGKQVSILFVGIVIIAFFFLGLRLFYLQIIKGDENKKLAENNRIRLRKLIPQRGLIIDRHGTILAGNIPSYRAMIVPEDFEHSPDGFKLIARCLNINVDEIQKRLKSASKDFPFRPVTIKTDLNWKEVAHIEEERSHLPGVQIVVSPKRYYPFGKTCSHVIGYMGMINVHELRKYEYLGYQSGDWLGRSGIEASCEPILRGKVGGRQIEVDAIGRELKTLSEVLPIPGNNVILTIDLPLQKKIEEIFKGKIGAVIAIDPRNGEILSMVSSPSFDPGVFYKKISKKEWMKLVKDPFHPFQNRCIMGQYPPGSLFKVVVAAAALKEALITPSKKVFCPATFILGDQEYRDWKEGGFGDINLKQALIESCDVYFYKLGYRLGIEKIAKYARLFGLGRKTGIDIPGEKSGLVPDKNWKRKRFNEPWYLGETITCSIGQGYLLVTPIQVASLFSAIANGGILYRPHLIKRIERYDGIITKEILPEPLGKVSISKENLDVIRKALIGVVNSPVGTGRRCKMERVLVGGKTGTAQVISIPKNKNEREIPFKLRDHAWFAAFAPAENPELVVVVLVEHGGHGGNVPALVAKDIFDFYFRRKSGEEMQMVMFKGIANDR
ncbi:MAG: penicillin-binding protein 2 [Deltaproteobacteria bacterium]|nr:penicillin-binding protein 2 [Deltaproteobacteria bacterium]RLA90183.1 MAG: penicillin-binding protein 2 [Deltaproteobacteria bacterium]